MVVIVQIIVAEENLIVAAAVVTRLPASVDLPLSTYFRCIFEARTTVAVRIRLQYRSGQNIRPNTHDLESCAASSPEPHSYQKHFFFARLQAFLAVRDGAFTLFCAMQQSP